jgi:hypothetical protein
MDRFDKFLSRYLPKYLANEYINEIIITDENGNDVEKIKCAFPDSKLVLIKNERRLGPFLNKLKACSFAKNEWIVLMDSDNFANIDYFEIAKNYIQHLGEQKNIILAPSKAQPNFDYSHLSGFIYKRGSFASNASAASAQLQRSFSAASAQLQRSFSAALAKLQRSFSEASAAASAKASAQLQRSFSAASAQLQRSFSAASAQLEAQARTKKTSSILMNTGNYVINKCLLDKLNLDAELRNVHKSSACDVVYLNTLLFEQADLHMHVVPHLVYEHVVHDGSIYLQTSTHHQEFNNHVHERYSNLK